MVLFLFSSLWFLILGFCLNILENNNIVNIILSPQVLFRNGKCVHVAINHLRVPAKAGQTLVEDVVKLRESLLPAMSQSSASEAFAKASSSSGSRVTLSSTGSIGFCLGTQTFPAKHECLLQGRRLCWGKLC